MNKVLRNLIIFFVLFLTNLSFAEPPKNILTSFYPMYIMALNVTKNVPGVRVVNLTPPVTGCLHDYSLTTSDMKKFNDAQLFVTNGAGMESFLDQVARQYPNLTITRLADGIPLIPDNPHVWVSITNAIIEVKNLGQAMSRFDPDHASMYQQNTNEYVAKLEQLRVRMQSELAPFKGKKIITFHEAFPYFAKEFGLKIAAVIEREPGSSPSARELAQTIELIQREGITTLFIEPQYPPLSAETLSRETGAQVFPLDPAVTGPADPDAYLTIMETNLKILKEALQ